MRLKFAHTVLEKLEWSLYMLEYTKKTKIVSESLEITIVAINQALNLLYWASDELQIFH